ncbi:hypothetical protein [Bizionia sp. M204]|uniref:hypothetical protein n=1 Tax=Bizionia sp. M204 TaxID=2675331 RepID=UPI00204E5492|nr:hypothetical protein [Bizionia sp. M204]UPS92546.1 hypothetical protein GMA17_12785 [Bizionia sp. M204]
MKKLSFNVVLVSLAAIFIIVSCKKSKEEQTEIKIFNELDFVLNNAYEKGDVRRYGLTFDNAAQTHPKNKKGMMETVLDVAELGNIEMTFQKGYYKTNLVLNHRKNLNLKFNNSEFSLIHITQTHDTLPRPENINLKGSLISYASLGITNASNIAIDSIILKSDTSKNLWGLRNAGCHIYLGCNDIKINYLEVQDLGSGNEKYKNVHAAVTIDGAGNNPVNVQIKKIHIKSSDRHGIYMTGRDHLIDEVIIDKFGVGSSEGMSGMQDAENGEEKDFKALWINKCYDSFIENITINELESKGKYTAHFDSGNKEKPVTIGKFKVINNNPDITILEEDPNGVIIEIKE